MGGVNVKLDIPILLTLERAREIVPDVDCSGRVYNKDEKEDIARFMVEGAEYQRDMMVEHIKTALLEEHPYSPQFTPDVIGRCMICGVKKAEHPEVSEVKP